MGHLQRRPAGPVTAPTGYYIEPIHNHHSVLCTLEQINYRRTPSTKWFYFNGLYWPDGLESLPGPWNIPFTFSFSNLTILDLDVKDAVYWLIPILHALHQNAPLRCIILHSCVDHNAYPLPFPFHSFNSTMLHHPATMLLLTWGNSEEDCWIQEFHFYLPILNSTARILILYSGGPLSTFTDPPSPTFISHYISSSYSSRNRLRQGVVGPQIDSLVRSILH